MCDCGRTIEAVETKRSREVIEMFCVYETGGLIFEGTIRQFDECFILNVPLDREATMQDVEDHCETMGWEINLRRESDGS